MYEAVTPDFTWTVYEDDALVALDSREKIADFFEQRRGRFENVRFEDVVYHHAPEETFMTFRMTGTETATGQGFRQERDRALYISRWQIDEHVYSRPGIEHRVRATPIISGMRSARVATYA